VIAQVARLTLPGVALGLATVWSSSGLLNAFVFGVQARSPLVLADAGVTLLLRAVIPTLPPAFAPRAWTSAEALWADRRRGTSCLTG
jgi:hypothetical protein